MHQGTYGPLLALAERKREKRLIEGQIGLEARPYERRGISLEVTDVVKHFPIKRGLLFSREVE